MASTVIFAALVRFGVESLNLGWFSLPLDYDYIIYPAGFASIVCLITVSYLTPPSDRKKWGPFWASEGTTEGDAS
jgi:hypothetical protein